MANLYNQETNLAAMGRFAPGVNYRADIKKPSQPVPEMPKANSSFNIDLSSIGNAMIRSAELEAQMEEKKLERQDRLDAMMFEDKRIRELADLDRAYKYDQLGVTREGNYLDYWAKMAQLEKASKSGKEKDYTWKNELDIGLRKIANTRDQKGGSASSYQVQAESLVDEIRNKYGTVNIDPDDLNKLLERYGFGYKAMRESVEEAEKKERTAENELFQQEYDNNSYMQSVGYTTARAKYNALQSQLRTFQEYQTVKNNPNATEEEKKVASQNMVSTGVNIIRESIYTDIYNSAQLKEFPTNPIQYKQAIKNRNIERLVKSGTEYNDAVTIVEQASKNLGLDRFTEQAVNFFKKDPETTKNVIEGMISNRQLQFTNIPAYLTWISLDSATKQGLVSNPEYSKELMENMLGMIHGTTLGDIQEDTNGDITLTINGKTYTPEQIELMRSATGLENPRQAVMAWEVQQARNLPTNLYNGLVSNDEANRVLNSTIIADVSNSRIESFQDAKTVRENAITMSPIYEENYKACKETGKGDLNACMLIEGFNTLAQDQELNDAIANVVNSTKTLGQPVKIAIQRDGKSNVKVFYQDSEGFDITDDNYTYVKKLEEIIRKAPPRADSKMLYLQHTLGSDRCVLIAPGVEVNEKKPNILQKAINIPNKADTALMQGIDKINFEKAVKKAVDTAKNTPAGQTMSSVLDLSKQIGESIWEYLVNSRVENPTVSEKDFKVVNNGDGTYSTIESEIWEYDGVYYIIPTHDINTGEIVSADENFKKGIHLGGYKSKEAALKAEKEMKKGR